MVAREEVNDTTGEICTSIRVPVALYGSRWWNKTCFISLHLEKEEEKKEEKEVVYLPSDS
jgi:hypothetical protein